MRRTTRQPWLGAITSTRSEGPQQAIGAPVPSNVSSHNPGTLYLFLHLGSSGFSGATTCAGQLGIVSPDIVRQSPDSSGRPCPLPKCVEGSGDVGRSAEARGLGAIRRPALEPLQPRRHAKPTGRTRPRSPGCSAKRAANSVVGGRELRWQVPIST